MKKNKVSKFNLIFIAVILLVTIVLLINFSKKNGFHMDEIYSYGLSNSYYEPFPWKFNEWIPGDYYQNYVSTSQNDRFSFGSVFYNQSRDVHPPFYYLILHTVSSLFPNIFSKWIGLSINLIIHLVTFYFVFLIIKKITNNKWISLSGAIFWILSKGAIDSLNFIRMYPLLTLIQTILLYLILLYHNENSKSKFFILSLFITYCLGALTHYYFYLYAFILTLVICLILLFEKRFKRMFIFAFTALLGVCSAMLIFPSVFNHVTQSNRGQEVLDGFENNIFQDGNTYFNFVRVDLFKNLPTSFFIITISILFVLLIISYWNMRKNKSIDLKKYSIIHKIKILVILLLPTSLFIYIVQQVSHYETPRYIFAVYPTIIIIVFFCGYHLLKFIFNCQVSTIIIGVLTITFSAYGLISQTSDYYFTNKTYLSENIEDINNSNVLVLMDQYWKITNYVLDLRDFNEVLPVEIGNDLDKNLPDNTMLKDIDNLYILYSKNDDIEEKQLIDTLLLKYNFSNLEKVTETQTFIIYKAE